MKLLWLKLLPLAASLLVLAACATARLGGFKMDVVEFKSDPAAPEEKRAAVVLAFNNDNVMPVAISSSEHKLYLNGTYVGRARTREALGSPQLSSVTQTLPLVLENAAFVRQLLAGGARSAQYRLDSKLVIQSDEEHLTIKTDSSGTVGLDGLGGLR